ncbi:MAG: hypothetical protein EA417_16570 [Gammaproteobacteria bacterium]|nr:MAG: hypothetical protein EA417_16570 [Gammaproteobacteria bacterium]
MSTTKKSSSEGILTTQKLKALLDSGLGGPACSRKTLAEAMSRAGLPISVHGIDAWFKHVDSNYAIPRASVDHHRRSYPIPAQRWPVLLQIFGIDLNDLELDDARFRQWCFARRRRQCVRRAEATLDLHLVHWASAGPDDFVAAERAWLTELGCRVEDAHDLARQSDTALVRALQQCHAVLWHLSPAGTITRSDAGVLDYVLSQQLPLLVSSDAATSAPRDIQPDRMIPRPLRFGRRYQQHLLAGLTAVAGEPLEAQQNGAFWATQEPITDRPSIAVLPFVNLTGSDAHEILAESMTEELTTLLARIPEFFVIAHATTRIYRHALPDPQTVRRQLGIHYVLEGSIRSAGQQLRISAQLVDAQSGAEVWSHRFDRVFAAPFAAQDELTAAICAQLEPRLRLDDMAYGARSGNLSAWRLWQEGWYWLFVDAPAPKPERSLERFRQALELEPDFGLAEAGIAISLATALLWGGDGREVLPTARRHAERAFQLLPEHPVALYAMGMITFTQPGGLAPTLEYLERAVQLEPSNAMYQGVCGYLIANLGRSEEGLERCRYAMRLSPKDSREPFLCYMLGNACIANGRYEEAIEVMARCRRFSEVDFIWIMLGFAYAQLGEQRRALGCLRQIEQPRPYRFYRFAVMESLWLGIPKADKEAYLSLLPQAGISAQASGFEPRPGT